MTGDSDFDAPRFWIQYLYVVPIATGSLFYKQTFVSISTLYKRLYICPLVIRAYMHISI